MHAFFDLHDMLVEVSEHSHSIGGKNALASLRLVHPSFAIAAQACFFKEIRFIEPTRPATGEAIRPIKSLLDAFLQISEANTAILTAVRSVVISSEDPANDWVVSPQFSSFLMQLSSAGAVKSLELRCRHALNGHHLADVVGSVRGCLSTVRHIHLHHIETLPQSFLSSFEEIVQADLSRVHMTPSPKEKRHRLSLLRYFRAQPAQQTTLDGRILDDSTVPRHL
ncbi:hypothetical protein BKA70DRAFT_1532597 [Coprinopsis sp. MPI-PUGE-AT-0042]|nr:hypothetical protein BKA70DRAFT_1532597 [Coprinopsis sp. MPI-PUGE-AT-0042]